MRTLSRSLLVLFACIAFESGVEHAAYAQSDADRATARALGEDGERALEAKDYKTAADRFRRADSLFHAPTLMLGLARALAGEGKFVEAQEAYNRIIREGVPATAPPVFHRALDDARKEVQQVEPRTAGLTVTVRALGGGDVPNATVTIDNTPVSSASLGVRRLVDPGEHIVKASAEGFKPAELRISVTQGGSADAPLTLEKDLSAATGPSTTTGPAITTTGPGPTTMTGGGGTEVPTAPAKPSALPWVAFGIGGAGLIAGAVTGAIALGKHSDLSKSCTGGSCGPAQQDELSSYHSMGLISTIGFVVAGVGVATGVTLLVVRPKGTAAPATGVYVGPGSIGAVGSF
jgi:hypothetical protein